MVKMHGPQHQQSAYLVSLAAMTNQQLLQVGGANHNPDWVLKLRFWPDSTFSYLTMPDTGQCRGLLAPTGFLIKSTYNYKKGCPGQRLENMFLDRPLMPTWEVSLEHEI